MAGHAQLKFVMTECSKTQIRLAGLIFKKKKKNIKNIKIKQYVLDVYGLHLILNEIHRKSEDITRSK